MARHFVTFGQIHKHTINGLNLDGNCVATYEAENYSEGRNKAFELFGKDFFTDYHDTQWDSEKLSYFPNGLVNIDNGNHNCNENIVVLLLKDCGRAIKNNANDFKYKHEIVGESVACSICEFAAIDKSLKEGI